MEKRLPRKLAAILYADVVEYSRLTGEDEDATHRTLSEYLDQIANTVETYNGSVMHYAGDAVLASFEAVVDALSCAVQIQLGVETSNLELSTERQVRFRIGVNLGDVIEDRERGCRFGFARRGDVLARDFVREVRLGGRVVIASKRCVNMHHGLRLQRRAFL